MVNFMRSLSISRHMESGSYHDISYDHCGKKKRNADVRRTEHAVPHQLNPLATIDAKNDHERVKEIAEVPQRHDSMGKIVRRIVVAEQLHAHDGEDKDDDSQHEAEVAQRTQSSANNTHQ